MTGIIRLNLGSGGYNLPGFVNLDADPACQPDIVATVPPLPYPDGAAIELYLGHVLEHFDYDGGQALLRECYRVLVPGGRLGVVVPDTREIMRRWLTARPDRVEGPPGRWWYLDDLDDVCAYFLFSTYQPSRHQWAYDGATLPRALMRAGFTVEGEIDRLHDPRLASPQWYHLGCDCVKPDVANS